MVILTVITGIIYPFFITGVSQIFFREQANGSLIYKISKPAGSELIGQPFDDPKYFWGRVSATAPFPYNSASSSGSNLGPSNQALTEQVKARIAALKAADPNNTNPIPVDLVTASASGLDPHISLAAAYYQIPRVAGLRTLPQDTVKFIVNKHTRGRFLWLLGEPSVNVLQVNLELDSYKK